MNDICEEIARCDDTCEDDVIYSGCPAGKRVGVDTCEALIQNLEELEEEKRKNGKKRADCIIFCDKDKKYVCVIERKESISSASDKRAGEPDKQLDNTIKLIEKCADVVIAVIYVKEFAHKIDRQNLLYMIMRMKGYRSRRAKFMIATTRDHLKKCCFEKVEEALIDAGKLHCKDL